MAWRTDGSHEAGSETAKCRWDVVPYMLGRCLDLGCGPYKCFPHFTGIDNGKDTELFGAQIKPNVWADVTDLKFLSSGEYDLVFSSHTLEHVEFEKVPAALAEWFRLVKVGGHLILYLPDADEYPQCSEEKKREFKAWFEKYRSRFHNSEAAVEEFANVRRRKGLKKTGEIYAGTPYANPDHKWDATYEKVIGAMPDGWDLVEFEKRNQGDEYSLWFVFKRVDSGRAFSFKNPKPKTAAIVRYGAIGDMMMASSIFPRLKEQGFHVTLYCSPGPGYEAIKHDPNVDRFILQGKDNVPPQFLGEFWNHTRKKYDRFINLSESCEGTFLACPDRVDFYWPNDVRAKYMDHNYLEFVHELSGVPGPYEPRFYSTPEEQKWARELANGWGRKNVLWSLAGSSGHKVWPHLDAVIGGIMHNYHDVHVVLVGDDAGKILEVGHEKNPRVHCMSGEWTIRESLAFAEVADVVVGTETGLLNAIGCMDIPKVINLSHSSENMLTKHWRNVTVLQQPKGVGCSKSPCRQLHGGSGFNSWIDCPRHEETGTALCQFHIEPDMVWQGIRKILGEPKMERKAA